MSRGIKLLSVFLLIVAILVVLFVTGIIGKKDATAPTNTETPITENTTGEQNGQLSDKEVQKYIKAVNKLFLGLPADEKPLVAKIVDVEKLRSEQQFYKDAQNDDVLVIYPSVAKAIIYRASTNQIVNAGPLIVNQDEKGAASTPKESTPAQTTESKQ